MHAKVFKHVGILGPSANCQKVLCSDELKKKNSSEQASGRPTIIYYWNNNSNSQQNKHF